MKHPYLANSTAELIEEVTSLIPKGYLFYVCGPIKEGEAPEPTDEEVLQGIEGGKQQIPARKNRAQMRYLRLDRFCVLMATKGVRPFLPEEEFLDIREYPVPCDGYYVSYRRTRDGKHGTLVELAPAYLARMTEKYLACAVLTSAEILEGYIRDFNCVPIPLVEKQIGAIVEAVNHKRRTAGLPLLRRTAVGLKETEGRSLLQGASKNGRNRK
jgi:hypothetical protein